MSLIATPVDEDGNRRELLPVCRPNYFNLACDKIRARWEDFWRAGWTTVDLTSCALAHHGYHGLAMYLRPGQDLARIWEWCVEILGSVAGNGERSILLYWKRAPLAELLATVGEHVIPAEVRERWRLCKL